MDIGTQLHDAREAHGLSLEDLAMRTRVPIQRLAALERNDIAGIPPRPYGRGFVRAYAREVGLDPDETVREYFAPFAPAPAPARPPVAAPPVADSWRSRSSVPAVVMLTLLAGVVLWAGWPHGVGRQPQPQAVRTDGLGVPVQTAGVGTDGEAAAPPSAPAAGSPSPELLVVLDTTAEAWVAANADGQRVLYQLVPGGSRQTIRAARELTLRVGNATVVTWTVNGRSLGSMGEHAAPRTVVVTAQNAASIR
jgi:cytoskeleton protein RodZ